MKKHKVRCTYLMGLRKQKEGGGRVTAAQFGTEVLHEALIIL